MAAVTVWWQLATLNGGARPEHEDEDKDGNWHARGGGAQPGHYCGAQAGQGSTRVVERGRGGEVGVVGVAVKAVMMGAWVRNC